MTWTPVEEMIKVAQPLFEAEKEQLKCLLENNKFDDLQDPFLLDFGTARWLKPKNEVAYSDWLAWIVERLKKAELILPLILPIQK